MKRRDRILLVWFMVCLSAIVLGLDLQVPLGVAGGVPYVAVVLISLWLADRRYLWVVATGCSVLVLFGWAYSPPGGETWKVAFNRGLAIFAIWVTAGLGRLNLKSQQELSKAHRNLEKRVQQRTVDLSQANEALHQEIAERKQFERALSRSECQLRTIADNMPGLIAHIGQDERFIFANRRHSDWFGLAPDEVVGKQVKDLLDPTAYRTAQPHIRAVLEGQAAAFENEMLLPNGQARWAWVNFLPDKASTGQGNGFFSVVTDITRLKQTEQRLLKKNALLRLVDAVAVAANQLEDTESALRIALEEICKHTGWSVGHVYMTSPHAPGELRSTDLWCTDDPERFETFQRIMNETHALAGVGLPARVFSSGRPLWVSDVTKNTASPMATHAHLIGLKGAFGFPVLAGNDVLAVLEFFSNKTDTPDEEFLGVMSHLGVQLGQAIRHSRVENNLRVVQAAIEHVYDAVVITSADLTAPGPTIQYVNPAFTQLTGYTSEEVIGKSTQMLQGPKPDQRNMVQLSRQLEAGRPFVTRTTNCHKDGTEYALQWRVEPVHNTRGQITHWVSIQRDVTKRLETKEYNH